MKYFAVILIVLILVVVYYNYTGSKLPSGNSSQINTQSSGKSITNTNITETTGRALVFPIHAGILNLNPHALQYSILDLKKYGTTKGSANEPYYEIKQVVPADPGNPSLGIPAIPAHNVVISRLYYNLSKPIPAFLLLLIQFNDLILKDLSKKIPNILTDGKLTLTVTEVSVVSLVPAWNGMTFNTPGTFSITENISGKEICKGGWDLVGNSKTQQFRHSLYVIGSSLPNMDVSKFPPYWTNEESIRFQKAQDSTNPNQLGFRPANVNTGIIKGTSIGSHSIS